ncbi:hypothetical protein V6Z11_A11G162700 [Gossypium hirsutum]
MLLRKCNRAIVLRLSQKQNELVVRKFQAKYDVAVVVGNCRSCLCRGGTNFFLKMFNIQDTVVSNIQFAHGPDLCGIRLSMLRSISESIGIFCPFTSDLKKVAL